MGLVPFASEGLLTLSWPCAITQQKVIIYKQKRILTRNFDLLDFDLGLSRLQNMEKINFYCLNN